MENFIIACHDGQIIEVQADQYEKATIGNDLFCLFVNDDDAIVEQILASEVANVGKI